MKLDSAKDILEWVSEYPTDATVTQENWDSCCKTAAYLAYCVRVTAIVEREATEEYAWSSPDCHDILKEAEKEQGK